MTSSAYDVLLQGSSFCDLTFAFSDLPALPGLGQEVFADQFAVNPGGVFNIASALARFGFRVGMRTDLGNDIFSRFIGERMRESGISLELIGWLDEPIPVVSVGISFPHDRLFVSYAPQRPNGARPRGLTGGDLDRYAPRAVFTYGERELCLEAHRRGIFVFVDAFWDANHLRSPALRDILPYADLFCPNLAEALEMTGTSSATEALDIISAWCPCVVIKCGAEGCIAQYDNERFQSPALPVKAVDTTGAGDNFNAGLLYGILHGYPFEESLRCANIAGGLSTLVLGGSSATTSVADLEKGRTQCR